MARTLCLLALALLLVAKASAQGQSCAAAAPGVKIRSQALIQLKDPQQDMAKADAAVKAFITQDCKPLASGFGPALSTQPSFYGIKEVRPGMEFFDHGAWMEFASLDDSAATKTCYANGLKSGNLAAIRAVTKKATRLTYDLKTAKANAAAGCTAGVRYMFSYTIKDAVNDAVCKKAVSIQDKIVTGPGAETRVRSGDGCDVVSDPGKFFGPGITKTADYGGTLDFKNTDNMLKILTNSGTASSISELRALAGTSMRGAIAHTGTASRAVAKERGFIAGRRFLRARVRIEQESCELRSCELDSNSSRSPVSLSLVTAVYEIV